MTAQLQTRAQRDLRRAVELISEFKKREREAEAHALFTRRAKQFPALVMQVGLAQALAFSTEKKAKDKGHEELLRQVGAILDKDNVLDYVQTAPASEYMHQTRRVLGAWNYHRRFAVTILGDDEGVNDEE